MKYITLIASYTNIRYGTFNNPINTLILKSCIPKRSIELDNIFYFHFCLFVAVLYAHFRF